MDEQTPARCPWCGNEPDLHGWPYDPNSRWIICESCGATGPVKEQEQAIAAWNRVAKAVGMLDRYKALLDDIQKNGLSMDLRKRLDAEMRKAKP